MIHVLASLQVGVEGSGSAVQADSASLQLVFNSSFVLYLLFSFVFICIGFFCLYFLFCVVFICIGLFCLYSLFSFIVICWFPLFVFAVLLCFHLLFFFNCFLFFYFFFLASHFNYNGKTSENYEGYVV